MPDPDDNPHNQDDGTSTRPVTIIDHPHVDTWGGINPDGGAWAAGAVHVDFPILSPSPAPLTHGDGVSPTAHPTPSIEHATPHASPAPSGGAGGTSSSHGAFPSAAQLWPGFHYGSASGHAGPHAASSDGHTSAAPSAAHNPGAASPDADAHGAQPSHTVAWDGHPVAHGASVGSSHTDAHGAAPSQPVAWDGHQVAHGASAGGHTDVHGAAPSQPVAWDGHQVAHSPSGDGGLHQAVAPGHDGSQGDHFLNSPATHDGGDTHVVDVPVDAGDAH